jgi:hypothetical protein
VSLLAEINGKIRFLCIASYGLFPPRKKPAKKKNMPEYPFFTKKTRMKSKTSHPSNENLKGELPFLWAVKAVQFLGHRS